MKQEDGMTRIRELPHGPDRDLERSSAPDKDVRVLLMVQDGKTPYRWRAFGRWSVPTEVIAQARERCGLTCSDSVLFLRISTLPDQDGGNGSTALFWDVAMTRPMPAWYLVGLEAGRTYTLVLGLLRAGNLFHPVAGPMVFHAAVVDPRGRGPASPNEECLRRTQGPARGFHV